MQAHLQQKCLISAHVYFIINQQEITPATVHITHSLPTRQSVAEVGISDSLEHHCQVMSFKHSVIDVTRFLAECTVNIINI